jgi:hypothetical protein
MYVAYVVEFCGGELDLGCLAAEPLGGHGADLFSDAPAMAGGDVDFVDGASPCPLIGDQCVGRHPILGFGYVVDPAPLQAATRYS